jgi:DNA-binding NtrC family response regulator
MSWERALVRESRDESRLCRLDNPRYRLGQYCFAALGGDYGARIRYTGIVTSPERPESSVLVVDDEESQRLPLAAMIRSWGFAVETAANGVEALEKLGTFPANVIVTDLMMPRMDGFELMQRLAAEGRLPPAIVLTAFGNIETAIQTIHDLGAFWFHEKPIQPNALRVLLERASTQSQLTEETERLQRQLSYQGVLVDMVGVSEQMQQVFSVIRQVAPSKAPVLVVGESGTGKELVARAVHQLSDRRGGPFIAINCAALTETLMESELFGHEKGAFTGALERRAGCFELAQRGTLLLDELAEMPPNTQAKLLRVVEDSKVRRLGGKAELSVDVRIIASTNRNPEEALKKGLLREDLYYRLNVFQIALAPLRQRMSDVEVLCETLVGNLNRKHGCNVSHVSATVMAAFQKYDWPGNVRELRNVLERAVIVAGEGSVEMVHLPYDFGVSSGNPAKAPQEPDTVRLQVGTTVSQAEKALIQATLHHTKNNKTRAAEILGISLKTLFNKLKEYGGGKNDDEERRGGGA